MIAGKYDFTLQQGATFRRAFTWKREGVPLPLSGFTAAMEIRRKNAEGDLMFTLTTENGGIVLEEDGRTGEALVLISAADSSAVPAPSSSVEKLAYDLELHGPAGLVVRLVEGHITYKPEVTR